ncbi:hypothetical protein MNBD_NITROSPINAE04-898 [hydrothermal vent metagenome]|uniref:Pathogenicity locus n=1 Tax=hydrothermal vent metagenome TaxID=652676 RepID=A0A3B1CAG0_9ZZZZ
MNDKDSALKDLKQIPGIGPKLAEMLWNINIRSVRQLKGRNPEKLYEKLCDYKGVKVDPCVLYVFRCAVYYASEDRHDPKLLKWWNWKKRKI